MKQRKIIHLDMDAFYASIEQRDNPSLKNRPVIVGGSPEKRGVVSTCSYEARKFGIHSAMPCSKAARLCPDAVFIRPRIPLYRKESQKIFAIYSKYCDAMEPLSLDEAFLDVSLDKMSLGSATKTAQVIKKEVNNKVGLTVSAGVSYNKFLAKLASDMHKPDGLTIITPEKAIQLIGDLPVEKFFGIGKATAERLHKKNIFTGNDILNAGSEKLYQICGKSGHAFFNYAKGIDERPVSGSRVRKSCGKEITFERDILSKKEIVEIIRKLSYSVSGILGKKDLKAHTITLKIRYHDFSTITRSKTSAIPFSKYRDLLINIKPLLEKTDVGKKKVRLVGVSTSNFENEQNGPRQLVFPFSDQEL